MNCHRRTHSRRSFLRVAASATAAAAAPDFLRAAPRFDPMQRIAMTTVVFRFRFAATRPPDYRGTEPELTLLDIPAYFADRFGVHNLEFWSLHFESRTTGYLADLERTIARSRSRLINLQIDQPYNLADADETERRRSIELVKEWVEVAKQLGSRSVRVNVGRGEVGTAIESLRELAVFGSDRGMPLRVENHGGISTDPAVLLQVLGAIPSDDFGAVLDFGNFPDELDRYTAMERLLPYTRLISAKTQVFDDDGEHTSFDFDRCIRVAERAGYRGIYSAEQWDPSTEPRDFERIADWMIEHIRANLRSETP